MAEAESDVELRLWYVGLIDLSGSPHALIDGYFSHTPSKGKCSELGGLPRCPASRVNQSTKASSEQKLRSTSQDSRVWRNPSCGCFQSLWSVWIVASRSSPFLRKN